MVEQQIGINVWDKILDTVKPQSGGVYTSVEDFPDDELLAMITELSNQTGTSQVDLIKSFGNYLFHTLAHRHTVFMQEPDFFSFLKSIEHVIHKEVLKLYPGSNLPSLDWEQPTQNQLVLRYHSPRRLCMLAVGLIKGAAAYYNTDYQLEHSPCMHDGASHCQFTITQQ